jgi:uncharacterized membrane protein
VRRTVGFRDATVLGGFAAPLFLWLAGLAVVLAATRTAERTGSRSAAVEMTARRGLEIFILGFLFRLQGFVITPGSHPVTLFRVDILNIMGPSMVVAGLLWALPRSTAGRVALYATVASAIAALTPLVRATRLVDALPIWLQWYMRPTADFTIFTLFPWAGFVFAGGAVGALLAVARDGRSERRLHVILTIAGVAIVFFGFSAAGRPSLYPVVSFWTSSPTWFAIRVGILMISLSVVYALHAVLGGRSAARGFEPAVDPLERLGRSSLFVYWIHVELVYGYASWLWRHRMPLWGTALAFCAFCVLMYGAVIVRDRVVAGWRSRGGGGVTDAAHAAPA